MACEYLYVEVLVDLIGEPATIQLLAAMGGIDNLYIPEPASLHADHRLVRAIGLDAARILATEYPGRNAMLPRGRDLASKAKVRAIKARLARGEGQNSIAVAEHVSVRYVRYIAHGQKGAEKPTAPSGAVIADLFDLPARASPAKRSA